MNLSLCRIPYQLIVIFQSGFRIHVDKFTGHHLQVLLENPNYRVGSQQMSRPIAIQNSRISI